MSIHSFLRIWVLITLGLVASTHAAAQALSLQDVCTGDSSSYDAATATCTSDGIVNLGNSTVVVIEDHETWIMRYPENFLGQLYNYGAFIMEDRANLLVNSLINLGSVHLWPGADILVGGANRIPSINVGDILNEGDMWLLLARLENMGTLTNEGELNNDGVIANRGHIYNSAGLLNNLPAGVIRNYRCPGSAGVVTAGAGNIVNDGTIEFINGKDC